MKRVFRFAVCALLTLTLLTANLCAASSASGFFSKVEMVRIANHIESAAGLNEYATVQGACADGKYAYFAFMQGAVCNIAKYDVKTWEYIGKEQIINMGHSNDMTYNSDEDYLVVANNAPYYDVITLIDPETLAPIKDVKIDEDIYAISYNAKHKTYVVGLSGSYDFALLDSEFKVKEKFKGVKTGYTRQGCDCDDSYIYFVQSGGSNLLVVYDYDGSHVASIPMSESDEVENIFHIGSAYYASLYYYGNKLHRIGFSDASKIAYTVSYDANGGEGEMEKTRVHYGEGTRLRKNAFTRDGYLFEGWRIQRTCDDKYYGRSNGAEDAEWLDEDEVFEFDLFEDEKMIARTVEYGDVRLIASWVSKEYEVAVNSGEGGGEPLTYTVARDEEFMVPDGGFTYEGYVFDGYEASREADGRIYGCRDGSNQPEWLYPSDAAKVYLLRPDDSVKNLTPDGRVTLTAQYQYAYTFGEDGSTLVEYVGVDERVNIPSNDGELKTLAEGAIKDNRIMKDLYIPAGVNSLHKQAVTNCPKLHSVYFEGSLPEEIDGESIVSDEAPVLYEVRGGQAFCIGFFTGEAGVPLLRLHALSLDKNYGSAFDSIEE